MTAKALVTAAKCLQRADVFRATADGLADDGDEWAAVCYFYAAYHVVRAAFIEDPVFDSIAAAAAKHPNLGMQDRWATNHQARLGSGPRALGINDIVKIIYPSIKFEYVELHSWSVNVRYNEGLEPTASIQDAARYYERIRNEYDAGNLKAT